MFSPQGIKALIEDFHSCGQTVIFYNVSPSLAATLRAVKPREFLHVSCRADLDALLRARAPPTHPHIHHIYR